MYSENGLTVKAPRNTRRLTVRIGIASLLVSGTALVSTVAPASAYYPPPDTGDSLSNYVTMDYSTGHGVY